MTAGFLGATHLFMRFKKILLFFSLGALLGFLTLVFHPQFSYFGVEFLRAQSVSSFKNMDVPAPYSHNKELRIHEAQRVTSYGLSKSPSRFQINTYHLRIALKEIRKNLKEWLHYSVYKLGIFLGPYELNNPYFLSNSHLYSYLMSSLMIAALLSLCFVLNTSIGFFSTGVFLVFFIFYSSSSFRLFLIPLCLILIFLFLKKLLLIFLKKKPVHFRIAPLCFVIIIIVTMVIPYYAPIGFSVKSLNRIQKAYVSLVQGHKLLEENKNPQALEIFQEGLKNWSYHTQLRVEVAKIYLSEEKLEEALNMLRNPRDNPYAHETLAHIYTQLAAYYEKTNKKFSQKARNLASQNTKKVQELRAWKKNELVD
ncbi:MAG: tetratricopeptide repeat protein [Deltaproteobacteria bacterium]|nr:tetratricopeptide repeat protein [Deltaproteobacteria bacterium]